MIRGQQTIQEGLVGRYEIWQRSLNDVKGSMIIGTGASQTILQLSDNGYVMMLLRTGLIGLSIYLLMLGSLFVRGFKAVVIGKERFRLTIILMSFMVLVSHMLYEVVADFLFNVDYIAIAALFLGFLCSMSRESLDEKDQLLYYYEDAEVQMA